MVKKNTTQLNNQPSLEEKGALFSDLTLDITSFNYLGLPREEVRKYVRWHSPKVNQDIIDRLIERYWKLLEQPVNTDEWDKYSREFRAFLRKIGIKLRDFDAAAGKRTCESSFLRFLTAYFLLAEDRAPIYVINDAYKTIEDKALFLFLKELSAMSGDLNHVIQYTTMDIWEGLYFKKEPQTPDVIVMRSGFLDWFKCRSGWVVTRAAAVLVTPYAWHTDCDPAEWVAYLFRLKGEEILPILRRILDALLDVAMGTEQLENKPLL